VVAGVVVVCVSDDSMPNSFPYCSHFTLLIFSSPHISMISSSTSALLKFTKTVRGKERPSCVQLKR
jgi:hypothetical protein